MPLPENPMSFYMKLTEDCPRDTILFVPNVIRCPVCNRDPPIQADCIYCGHKFKVEYIGNYIVHISNLVSDEVKDYIRRNE